MDRNLIAGVVVIAVVASAAAAILKARSADPLEPTVPAPKSRPAISALVPEQQRAPVRDASEEAALVAHVEQKYRYLIGEIDRAYVDELKQRLLDREAAVTSSARERLDSEIGEMLPPKDFEYYQELKDSDMRVLTPEQ